MSAPGHHRTFLIGACLGRGGFGEVYRARMRSPGGVETTVAIKVLRAELDINADAMRRLRDEGKLLARLDHPTILKVYDMALLAGRVAMVTELVEGADLSVLNRGSDPLRLRATLEVIARVAAALDAAWSTPGRDGAALELVHRDVKPPNIRVGRHGEVKLLDFGIAHFQATNREARTASDVVVGSLPYMAPERFVDRTARPASDVFGLGCALYETLAGQAFFHKPTLARTSALALDPALYAGYATERLAELPSDLPAAVKDVLEQMLRHDHTERPTSEAVSLTCDELAEEVGGPSLRAWARARRWSDDLDVGGGTLEGQQITEGTLEALAPSGAPGVVSIHRDPNETVEVPDEGRTTWLQDDPPPSTVPTLPPGPVHDNRTGWAPWIAVMGCAIVTVGLGVVVLAGGALTAGWFTVFR